MIVTVTLNPSMDKTGNLKQYDHGGINHITDIIRDAAGNGIIASKTLKALEKEDCIATGFLGGINGERIEMMLEGMGISNDFVKIAGDTRTNLKVVEDNGFVTEFNEPGPVVNGSEIRAITDKILGYASEDTVFIFSGSIPRGCPDTIYADLITKVKEKGSKVVLDVSGELLKTSIDAQPDIIKPNKKEIEDYYNMEFSVSEEGLIDMGRRIIKEKGVGVVAISRGPLGCLFITDDKSYNASATRVEAHSTVGAGASMDAAFALGLQNGSSLEDIIKLAMAIAAGSVTTIGTKAPSKAVVDELQKQVVIEEI
ncbi:MAG: 1-phosphofructokinase family hexose kinase [Lachnospiraceae bacterium]|nr:1-phosphofructokinase family hexose kinase [Lachnospiraceae bacterium]